MSIDYFVYGFGNQWPTARQLQQHFVDDWIPIRLEGLRETEQDLSLSSYGEDGDIWFSWTDGDDRDRIEAIPGFVHLADDDFASEHTEAIRNHGGSSQVIAGQPCITFCFGSGAHLSDQLQITAWFVGTLIKHYGAGFLDPQVGRFGTGTAFGDQLLSEAKLPGAWLSWDQ